ncbi:endonuclease/exonuclease/phosphatase family protein [Actinomadura flavalba]|uniref:endonuclease/exonuclease/phosphatase family protein n=1 Tax=Actinomadura flavalba TaxID=1120938 RepID=UPI00037A49A3|nr:endonuclease/exonuclease/phosphatase family protein [Actinomadura flavalba]
MRAPRALIPLLAVCGAAAIVAFAGAGAAIEHDPAPVLADSVVEDAAPATITAMTWNVCGDARPECPSGTDPGALVDAVAREAAANSVGGRRVAANAILLQEVCSAQVTALGDAPAFRDWTWVFSPDAPDAVCANGQGRPGVALGARGPLGDVRTVALPADQGQGRAAVCATSPQWATRLCSASFSDAAQDPSGAWRARQAAALAKAAGPGRTVFGGHLAAEPTAPALDGLYADFDECDEGPDSRDGGKTLQDWRGHAVTKTDYLFVNAESTVSCAVPRSPNPSSDHRPLTSVVHFP